MTKINGRNGSVERVPCPVMKLDPTKSVMHDTSFTAAGRLQKDAADSLPTFTVSTPPIKEWLSLRSPDRVQILAGKEVLFDGPVSELHPDLQQMIRDQCAAAIKSR